MPEKLFLKNADCHFIEFKRKQHIVEAGICKFDISNENLLNGTIKLYLMIDLQFFSIVLANFSKHS